MKNSLSFAFIFLWSSAFVTTKPIVDNSDPFSALAFRFLIVAIGFLIYAKYKKISLSLERKELSHSILSGVLFHGIYLGGVFYSVSLGIPNRYNCSHSYNATNTNKRISWTNFK